MWCHVGWKSATELHGTTFKITVIFRFNIHYLFLSNQTNSRYIQRHYKQLSHITHLPNYSSLSLTRYRIMSLKKSQSSSQHYPLCIQVIYNERLTNEWNALRAFWCTDIGHQCSKATKEKFTEWSNDWGHRSWQTIHHSLWTSCLTSQQYIYFLLDPIFVVWGIRISALLVHKAGKVSKLIHKIEQLTDVIRNWWCVWILSF